MDQENTILKNFFQNFLLHEKDKSNLSEEYIILLKILWHSFNEIALRPKTPRRVYLLEQVEKFLTNESFKSEIEKTELPILEESVSDQCISIPQVKLKEISLVNFRGFQSNSNGFGRKISFNEKATLFFAPNGGGKSSLCESLEWCLTGDSFERAKRKVVPNIYYQNTQRNNPSFKETKLVLSDDTNPLPNQMFDRCFLEKNRIEKFARIAIQSDIEIRDVLGELFGFSDIINFFKEFGLYISPSDIELEDISRKNWDYWCNWRKKKDYLEKSIEESKQNENLAKDELVKLTGDKSFDECEKELIDLKSKFNIELDNLQKDFSNLFSYEEVKSKISSFLEKIGQIEVLDKSISENAKDLDFENLFQAANIIFTNDYSDGKCPLCDTPFSEDSNKIKVVTDPRQKTKTELVKLKKLTGWKTEKTKIENELKEEDFVDIRNYWQKIQHNLIEDNWTNISGDDKPKPLTPEIDFDDLEKSKKEGSESFFKKCKDLFNVDLSSFLNVEKTVLAYISRREEKLKSKPSKELEVGEIDKKIKDLREKNNNFVAKQKIREKYESDLESLNSQSGNSQIFQKIINSYPVFYKSFESFQSESILKESATVDEFITGFYRSQNLHDHECEKIKSISFPKNISEEFCIVYEKDETKKCNALSLLSEGHLKTLGLAALLSRAMKFNAPILVFDDAINAIDSDHRDNLSLLLSGNLKTEDGEYCFGDKWQTVKSFIDNCQLIITSHDRFFDEKMANLISADKQKRYVLYSSKEGVDFCEVCEKGVPANFESKIDYFLRPEVQDIRSAIFYCRIWLEEVCLKIAALQKLKFKDSRIDEYSKQIKQPALEIILEVIKDGIQKITPPTSETSAMLAVIESIINEKGNMPWFFEILNQESHNRRFDHINISNAPTSREVSDIFNKIQTVNNLMQQSTNQHNA